MQNQRNKKNGKENNEGLNDKIEDCKGYRKPYLKIIDPIAKFPKSKPERIICCRLIKTGSSRYAAVFRGMLKAEISDERCIALEETDETEIQADMNINPMNLKTEVLIERISYSLDLLKILSSMLINLYLFNIH